MLLRILLAYLRKERVAKIFNILVEKREWVTTPQVILVLPTYTGWLAGWSLAEVLCGIRSVGSSFSSPPSVIHLACTNYYLEKKYLGRDTNLIEPNACCIFHRLLAIDSGCANLALQGGSIVQVTIQMMKSAAVTYALVSQYCQNPPNHHLGAISRCANIFTSIWRYFSWSWLCGSKPRLKSKANARREKQPNNIINPVNINYS